MSSGLDKIGPVCILYGFSIFLATLALIAFLSPNSLSTSVLYGSPSKYWGYSSAAAVGLFIARVIAYGVGVALTVREVAAAAITGLGFGLPLALIGLIVTGTSRSEYSGVERWLPQIKDPEAEIQRTISELELSEDSEERSLQILGRLKDREMLQGRSIEETVAAITYIAGRENSEPRSLDEISDVTGIDKREIGRAYRSIGRELDINIIPPQPDDYLHRFGERMGLSSATVERAMELVEQAKEKGLISGKSPTSVAASAIYLAAHMEGEKRSMRETSDILDVTTITIRNRSRELVKELELEDYPEHLIPDGE